MAQFSHNLLVNAIERAAFKSRFGFRISLHFFQSGGCRRDAIGAFVLDIMFAND